MSAPTPSFQVYNSKAPLMSLLDSDDDEESFVILGKSLTSDLEYKSTEIVPPNDISCIQEAKTLIEEEIKSLDEKHFASASHKASDGSEKNPFEDLCNIKKELEASQVDSVARKSAFSSVDGSSKRNSLEKLTLMQALEALKMDIQPESTSSARKNSQEVASKSSDTVHVSEDASLKSQSFHNSPTSSCTQSGSVWGQTPQCLQETTAPQITAKSAPPEEKSLPKENVLSNKSNPSNLQSIDQMSFVHLNSIPKQETKKIESEDLGTLSSEDLQKKILSIIEENMQLRKTLELNNIKMKEQCNRIANWQNEVKKVHNVHKEKLLEAKEHIDKLTIEKNDAKNEISALQEELNITRTKLAEIQIVQTEYQQNRSAAYAEIKALKDEIRTLQETIAELQNSPGSQDEVFALQTQLEVYKADFEAERQAKETIKAEKEQLSEDLQNLQRRNQQLQERIETISDRDFVMYESNRRQTSSSDNSQEASLECPKCRAKGFVNIRALESHCYVCID